MDGAPPRSQKFFLIYALPAVVLVGKTERDKHCHRRAVIAKSLKIKKIHFLDQTGGNTFSFFFKITTGKNELLINSKTN